MYSSSSTSFKSNQHSDVRYRLSVVQNPIRARCCGFGEKDRRPIDPPPILQLRAEDGHGNTINLKPMDSTLFLVQCELFNENRTEERNLVYTPWSTPTSSTTPHINTNNTNNGEPNYVKNLIGSSYSNAYHLYDENQTPGIYFIFQDLSVRTEGSFTLKFVFFNLAPGEPTARIEHEVFTNAFKVYPAKKFPGLTESTNLSRCFSRQGIKIPIRNECHTRPDTETTCHSLEQEDEPIPPRQYTRIPISHILLPDE